MLLPFRSQSLVIASFAHKGLERFYRTGNVSGVQAIHAAKLRLILSLLDAAQTVGGMRLPAFETAQTERGAERCMVRYCSGKLARNVLI
jgi:plasmid maintenance system killer protein